MRVKCGIRCRDKVVNRQWWKLYLPTSLNTWVQPYVKLLKLLVYMSHWQGVGNGKEERGEVRRKGGRERWKEDGEKGETQ